MEGKEKKVKEKKSKGKLLIYILIILLLLVIIGGGGFFGYKLLTQKPTVVVQNGTAPKAVPEFTFGLDEVLVNLSDQDSTRYVKCKVFIGYDQKKLTAELTAKKPVLRDAVINVIRTKKAEDFSSKNIDSIKTEILKGVNPLLTKGQATEIYFYDILVQ